MLSTSILAAGGCTRGSLFLGVWISTYCWDHCSRDFGLPNVCLARRKASKECGAETSVSVHFSGNITR